MHARLVVHALGWCTDVNTALDLMHASFMTASPRHLVLLADSAPHEVSDQLRSYAALLDNRFVHPILEAPSPSDLDRFISSNLHEFAILQANVALLLFESLGFLSKSTLEVFARLEADALKDLDKTRPGGLSAPWRETIVWSFEVFLFGIRAMLRSVPALPIAEMLSASLPQMMEAAIMEAKGVIELSMLVGPAFRLLDDAGAAREWSVAEHICFTLHDRAATLDDELRDQHLDWRALRDEVRGSRQPPASVTCLWRRRTETTTT